MNFIPSTYLNNRSYDGFQTTPLINDLASGDIAEIKQLVFLKGGERMPLQYNLDCNVRDDASSTISDPNLVRNFMNAFIPFMKNNKTQISPLTNNRVGFTSTDDFVNAGMMFGAGVSFDDISGEGVDFRSENFGLQAETGLTEDNPHSAFLYVRSKQTLVFNENGLQVIT